jgi:hypothetical protein
MRLDKRTVEEFQDLYEEKFGDRLPFAQPELSANEVVNFY